MQTFTHPPSWPEQLNFGDNLLTRIHRSPRQFSDMRFALLAGLASLASTVSATALTYRLEANEKACFYTEVEQANAKVAFYFAVSSLKTLSSSNRTSKGHQTIANSNSLCRSNLVVPSMSTTPS